MAKIKIAKRSVESLEPKTTDYISFDAELTGFGVRVMPSGKKFFLVQYRHYGRTRRVMIGQFGPVTAEEARRKALKLLGQAKSGDDPADARDKLRQSTTMKHLGERFLKEHVEVRLKASTQIEYAGRSRSSSSRSLALNGFGRSLGRMSLSSTDHCPTHPIRRTIASPSSRR